MQKKEFKDMMLLITYAIILFVVLLNYNWIGNIIGFIGKICSPFIIGFIIAFVLNVLVRILEDSILKKVKKNKRILSIVGSLTIIVGFIVFLLFILIPQIKNAGMIFIDNIPEYQETIYTIGEKIGLSDEVLEYIDLSNSKLKDEFTEIINNNSDKLISLVMVFATSTISGVTNFFVGLVFAIYVLLDKENLKRQVKKLLHRISREDIYEKILNVSSLSNVTFTNFVKVQVVEACILGSLCFVLMLIFGLPYAATISTLVGFTALVPVFGAFIGCVVGAFLIFMVSPVQAIVFVILFLVLQQIEGNFIYPKVVGGKIGLPSIWVLVAVMIGGSVGGIFGMLLGVPIFSIGYSLLKTYVNNDPKLKVKKIAKAN